MDDISRLLAEQSSPAEVIVFLAIIVAVFLGIAFLVYAVVMALLRLGLPDKVPLLRILFPSVQKLRENLGDYVLAAATSVLLSLTVMVKHDLVQQISNYDMGKVGAGAVAALFDFGLPDDLAQEIGQATLGEVVEPLLAAGKVEESDLLVRTIVHELPRHWLTPASLIGACFVLAAFYLLWLARRRYRDLRLKPDSAPAYAATFRPLLTLALCVGLLLASALPLAHGGERFLARSALHAIEEAGRSGRQASPVSLLIGQELIKQRERAEYLYCPGCEEPGLSIWETVGQAVNAVGATPAGTDRVAGAVAACQAACDDELASLEAALGPLEGRLAGLENRLNTLQRELAKVGEQQATGESDPVHARESEELARQLADLQRQVRLLGQAIEKQGALPTVPEDIQRRIAWLESQHRPQEQPPVTQRDAVCERYATLAVRQNSLNVQYKCQLTGARWSDDFDGHYGWCVLVPEALRKVESDARGAALKECRPPVQ